MEEFDHERLDVFRSAMELAEVIDRVVDQCEGGRGDLMDQIRRASSSICLNIAEGSGEFRAREKARLYRIARRSATECAAIIELLRRRASKQSTIIEHLDAARAILLRVVRMLVKMIQATERRTT